jgi:hypothetical protein
VIAAASGGNDAVVSDPWRQIAREFRHRDDFRRFHGREERAVTYHKSRYLVHSLPQPVVWLCDGRNKLRTLCGRWQTLIACFELQLRKSIFFDFVSLIRPCGQT